MKKTKPPVLASETADVPGTADHTWHGGADAELGLFAMALQRAAKALVEKLDPAPSMAAARDIGPIIVLYREAIELHLKALVSEGNNFLRTKVDPISLYKTDSLRWLAQIVCQIIRAVEWENEFRCEGVSDLTEFSAVVNDLERLDAVKCAVMSARIGVLGTLPPPMQKVNAVEFACRMDALIDLLDSAADALAATWEMMAGGAEGGAGSGQTIH